jgi:integrase
VAHRDYAVIERVEESSATGPSAAASVGTLAIRDAKSGQVRHVTLTGEAPELIERLVARRAPDDFLLRRDDGRQWKRAEQLRPMREACARAAILPPVGFHVLRHTHASILMRAVPMAVIARQLGHTDTRMTERHYAHLAPNYVADTIRANFPNLTGAASNVLPIRRAQISRSEAV